MLFEIKMQPGSVIVKEIDRLNYVIKLEFPKNQNEIYPIWLSEVTIQFLNIITGKGDNDKYIRDTYATYLKDVQQFVQEQNCLEEEAFDYVKKPYVKKDNDKALNQKITDVQEAIGDLCYCPIGSTPIVPGNARYSQKSYWQKFQNLTITTSRQYHERKDKEKKNVIALQFNSVHVSLFDIGWFKNRLINDLLYINVTITDTSLKAWETFAECLSTLSILLILRISADLEEIPDIAFQRMTDSVTHLNLAFNRLKTISSNISRLKQLKSLYLDYNENLENDGIPWENLPISIETFSCVNTGLKTISQNIQRLVNLKDLKLTNCNIQNIPWASVNSNITSITGTFNDITEINSNNFPHLEILDIRNANIGILSPNDFSLNLKQLHVFSSSIQVFNIIPDFIHLHTINLSNNKLTTFPFEFMPVNLANLYLSHNLFEKLDLMEHWIKIKCLDLSYNQISIIVCSDILSANFGDDVIPKLDLNLEQNKLQSLPIGFENYIQISELNIGNNPFVFEHLNDCLWNRLPKFLQSLTVDGLDLRTLPCALKNYPLNDLSASNCHLHYICPQLSRQCQRFLFLDITDNSTLKHLPFVPKKVFPSPDKNEIDIECYDIQEKWNKFGGNESHPIKIFTDISYRSNNEFVYDNENLLHLNFKKSRKVKKTEKFFCKCCANCGTETGENLVEQLMTMDYPIFQEVDDFQSKKNPSYIELWKAEKWKTLFKTRLCQLCLIWYKMDAKRIKHFPRAEKLDKKAYKNSPPTKKQKMERPENYEVDSDDDEIYEEDDEEFHTELQVTNSTTSNSLQPNISINPYHEPQGGSSSRTFYSTIQNHETQSIQQNYNISGAQHSQHPFSPQNYIHSSEDYNSVNTGITEQFSIPYQPSSECPISYVLFDPSTATDDDLKKL